MSNVRHPIKLLAHIRPQSGHIGLHLDEGTMHPPTHLIHPFLQLLRVADQGVNQGSQNCLWVLLRTRGLPFLWRPDRNQWWLLRNIPMQGVLRLQIELTGLVLFDTVLVVARRGASPRHTGGDTTLETN